jgi:hypothetical protein
MATWVEQVNTIRAMARIFPGTYWEPLSPVTEDTGLSDADRKLGTRSKTLQGSITSTATRKIPTSLLHKIAISGAQAGVSFLTY